MADTSTQEQASDAVPHTNGLDGGCSTEEDERAKNRPADIDADMREMERRKRVELIMNSRLFREELERIIETQIKDGGAGTSGLLQQIQDMMGIPKHANVFKGSNCVVPINDIRGVESMGYAKGEKLLRCKLAAVYRLMDLYGWAPGVGNQITARLNQDQEHFLVNPYGMLCHEVTASSLVKIDMQGNVVEQGTTNFGVNVASFSLHAAIHAARPDVKCAIHVHTPAVLAVSALKCGVLPISQESVVIGEVSTHPYAGGLAEPEEREKVARNLGPINKVLLLANHGAVCCGETVEEAFFNVYNTILACETQLKLLPIGIENLALVSDETRKQMYDAARRAPDGTASGAPRPMAAEPGSVLADKLAERKWRVGGVEFEALMRMLDNAGFRTGYIYRHPLIKGDPPRPRNDVEVPPAVSSLGYLLEEEEMYKQGIWKFGRKGNDRTRWLNSPNVYQKVEILETGTPDPKKITKWVDANADEWVADGSPTHSSTPVKIDAALQFVPKNTNPKEFKLLQQQIKDNRRADKISAGPQSHILEGVTWEEAKKMQDAGVTQTGDQVVVVGAASKGIIQRGYQHNAMVYKAPYAKNPFDSVTDEELDEYKKVIERKAKGDYDTDFSESESAQISKRMDNLRSPTSADETEEESRDEPRVLRIETKQAPKPSQPEVVLSDDDEVENVNVQLLNAERDQSQQAPVLINQNNKGSSFGQCELNSPRLVQSVPTTTSGGYRTNSYAGMPRGSYMVPNPVHFHIARIKYTAMLQRPLYVTFHHQECLRNLKNKHLPEDARVQINVTNIPRPLSIDLPINIIKQFLEPFSTVLNLSVSNRHRKFDNRENEALNSEDEYFDFNLKPNKSFVSDSNYEFDLCESPDEEYRILLNQREFIMKDIEASCSILNLDSSFSDIEAVDVLDEEDEVKEEDDNAVNAQEEEDADDTLPEKVNHFKQKIGKYNIDSNSTLENFSQESIDVLDDNTNLVEPNNNAIEKKQVVSSNVSKILKEKILVPVNKRNLVEPNNFSIFTCRKNQVPNEVDFDTMWKGKVLVPMNKINIFEPNNYNAYSPFTIKKDQVSNGINHAFGNNCWKENVLVPVNKKKCIERNSIVNKRDEKENVNPLESTNNSSEYKTAECETDSPKFSSFGAGDTSHNLETSEDIIKSKEYYFEDEKLRVGSEDNNTAESMLKNIIDVSKQCEKLLENNINMLSDNGKYIWPYHNCAMTVKLLSRKIYNFVIKTCVEFAEHLQLPEIRCYHDFEDFFDELLLAFDKFSDCFPSDKDIKRLRKAITLTVINNLDKHFLIVPFLRNNSNEVNQKIKANKFSTLKKFVRLIIYILFDKIENPEYQCTHYDWPDYQNFEYSEISNVQFHSTPEASSFYYTLSESSFDEENDELTTQDAKTVRQVDETPIDYLVYKAIPVKEIKKIEEQNPVTTFLAHKSEKSGSLQYWFMLNDKVATPKRTSSMLFNIKSKEEIPNPVRVRRSSAPARVMSDFHKPLSPIPEEARRNLSYEFDALSDQTDESVTASSNESERNSQHKHLYEINCDLNINGYDFKSYSVGSNSMNFKPSFKKRNGKLLFMEEITFIPKNNVLTNYADAEIVNSITFIPKTSDSDNNMTSNTYVSANSFEYDENNDWMGYESAKF